jgi:uncharacterized membrane protein YphA (DoxX/SURF4 family)
MDRTLKLLTWPAALFIAGILLWYEQFKLTGNQGSVDLFQTLADWLFIPAYEKPFRLGVAAAEMIASVLVVIPATRIPGAAFALGIMSGAIFFHLASPLGIDPYHDGGTLFKQACAVWLCSAYILFAYRVEAVALVRRHAAA